jgi:hypothetical protein
MTETLRIRHNHVHKLLHVLGYIDLNPSSILESLKWIEAALERGDLVRVKEGNKTYYEMPEAVHNQLNALDRTHREQDQA